MRLNDTILDLAKTDNGGYTKEQLAVLGVVYQEGVNWIGNTKGQYFTKKQILQFIEKRKGSKKAHKSNVKDELNQWQYQHPKWKKLRQRVLKRDNDRCRWCGAGDSLHVHHKHYPKDGFIWEIRMKQLITLCDKCHAKAHKKQKWG